MIESPKNLPENIAQYAPPRRNLNLTVTAVPEKCILPGCSWFGPIGNPDLLKEVGKVRLASSLRQRERESKGSAWFCRSWQWGICWSNRRTQKESSGRGAVYLASLQPWGWEHRIEKNLSTFREWSVSCPDHVPGSHYSQLTDDRAEPYWYLLQRYYSPPARKIRNST